MEPNAASPTAARPKIHGFHRVVRVFWIVFFMAVAVIGRIWRENEAVIFGCFAICLFAGARFLADFRLPLWVVPAVTVPQPEVWNAGIAALGLLHEEPVRIRLR